MGKRMIKNIILAVFELYYCFDIKPLKDSVMILTWSVPAREDPSK